MKFYIRTYGCQMNKSDSNFISSELYSLGYEQTDNENEADILIFNTCAVRENAANRLYGRIASLSSENKKKRIAIIGCLASMEKEKIKKKFSFVDYIANSYHYKELIEIIKNDTKNRHLSSVLLTNNNSDYKPINQGIFHNNDFKSFISITHGCDNFCTYCIVPYVRGKFLSFPVSYILEHIKKLENKISFIELLGQNVNSYGTDIGSVSFLDLLEKIIKIDKIKRISFLTSHPKDIDLRLFKIMKDNKKMMKYLHLPLQSGNDRILSLMNRGYTVSSYMKIIEAVKKEIPDINISTDIIVGFPGETDVEFQDTLNIIKDVEYNDAYMYAYSPRKFTRASLYLEQISKVKKQERLNILIQNMKEISKKKINIYKNKEAEILIERINKDGSAFGFSEYNIPTIINSDKSLQQGEYILTKIINLSGKTLIAKSL